jgi:sigma-B regulation protein RsbU (phosphoserine phosphatase)
LTPPPAAPTLSVPVHTEDVVAMGNQHPDQDRPAGHARDATHRALLESVPWRDSLRTRLLLLTSLGIALLLLGDGVLTYLGARQVLVEQSRREIRDLARQTARGLEAVMDSVVVSAATLSGSVRGIGFDEHHLRALLRATAKGDPDIAGAMLILEPGALRTNDPAFSWYARVTSTGFHEQPMRYDGYDYHDQPWWKRTVRDGKTWWSEPYRNRATGDVLFVTYNHPIHAADGKSVAGMVSVDVPVQRLRALVGGARRDTMLRLLLSPEHSFVIDPGPALLRRTTFEQAAADPRMPGLRALLQPLRDARAAEAMYTDPQTLAPRLAVLEPVGMTGWTVVLSVSDEYVLRRLRQTAIRVIAFGLLAALLALAAIWLMAYRITGPILGLSASASHFAAGQFDLPLPHTNRTDEVGLMARAFDHARGSIKEQLLRIEQLSAARQKLESELSIARDIQRAMLPPAAVLSAGAGRLQAHAVLEPAKAVGGDFYTFLQRDGHTLLFAIGDVSDKGVPAALFMARAITMLEVAAGMGGSPAHALRIAARRLVEGNETCMFATVLCGVADATTGEIVMASAGHEAPVLRRADGSVAFVPVVAVEPLGFEVAADFPLWHGRLQPGDALLAYTDGITEAFNDRQEAFGSDRLLQVVAAGGDARGLCEALVAAAHRFADGAPQSDDITVLALSFTTTLPGGA